MASKKRSKFSLDEETLGYYKNVSAMFNDKSQEQSEKGTCALRMFTVPQSQPLNFVIFIFKYIFCLLEHLDIYSKISAKNCHRTVMDPEDNITRQPGHALYKIGIVGGFSLDHFGVGHYGLF